MPPVASRPILVLAVMTLLAGCGLGTDGSPRLIADEDQRPLVEVTTELVSSGTGRIYLERTDETGRPLLVAVARQISNDPADVVDALLGGPTDDEQNSGIGSAIPLGTTLLDARYIATDMVRVDVSSDILESTGDDLVSALAQLVFWQRLRHDPRGSHTVHVVHDDHARAHDAVHDPGRGDALYLQHDHDAFAHRVVNLAPVTCRGVALYI